jgi:hypothetical protein
VYNGGYNGTEAAYGVVPHYGDGYAVHAQVLQSTQFNSH